MRLWRTARGAAALLSLGLALPAGATPQDPAFGHWLTENGRAIVRIAPCDSAACGHVVWTEGQGRRCGATILGALRREGPGRWAGGYVEDPRDGTRYAARLRAEGMRLELRGYVGLPLLGRSQTWTRVPDDRGGCPAPGG